VGGKVVDNCLECPFHKWKFASDGSVHEIPYLTTPHECHTTKKLKTFPCVDWCGLVMIYFHADDATPEFELPAFVPKELEYGGWAPHMKWDIGFKTLSPVDWVDQAGDHAHFATLHADFLIPWTLIPLPDWFYKLVPLGICHKLVTYRGDDKEWEDRVNNTGWGCVDKHLIFFSDVAGLTWNRQPIDASKSETIEMFIGPAIMVFNIPFTIGALKAFVTTTPTAMAIPQHRVTAIFQALDTNGNGVLEANDFELGGKNAAAAAKAHEGSDAYKTFIHAWTEAWKAISEADTNSDKKVTPAEFNVWFEKHFSHAKSFADLPVYWQNSTRAAFHSVDSDKNGHVSKEEYFRAYKHATGGEHGAAEGYAFFEHLGGGRATLEAFEKLAFHALLDHDEAAWKAFPFAAIKTNK